MFKSYPSLFPRALLHHKPEQKKSQIGATNAGSKRIMREHQARHVVDRIKREQAKTATATVKKTAAMLGSPYTEQRCNGLLYIVFDHLGAEADDPAIKN